MVEIKTFIAYIICTLLVLLLIRCHKINSEGYKTYIIKEGKHRSTFAYRRTDRKILTFDAIFDNSAIYTTRDPNNQLDINKLFGLSDCGTDHMDNSIRFGWRWNNDSLEIHWFKHEEGVFSFDKITSIELDRIYTYEIIITKDTYELWVGEEMVLLNRNCIKDKCRKNYYLYPYFGGDETAPHDIKILIKLNK